MKKNQINNPTPESLPLDEKALKSAMDAYDDNPYTGLCSITAMESAIRAYLISAQTPVPNEHSQEGVLDEAALQAAYKAYRLATGQKHEDYLDAAIQAYFAATPKPLSVGWISVKDKKPENDDMVLLLGRNGHPFTGWYNHGEIKGFMYIPGKSKHAVLVPMVTHWAILPAPPALNSEGE